MALRLMVYDQTDVGPWYRPGLSHSWWAGGHLYRGLGRLDAWHGFRDWDSALDWIADRGETSPIAEIQYWGHGKWGELLMDRQALDETALQPGHRLHPKLVRIKANLVGPNALWWFRTCETFGARRGHAFARAWADFFDCRVAGHTYIIGPYQSGLHTLRPGQDPTWSDAEGIIEGDPDAPKRAAWSTRRTPNTISFLHGKIPARF